MNEQVYSENGMIVVRKTTDHGVEITGYSVSCYDYIRRSNGEVNIFRRVDGAKVK